MGDGLKRPEIYNSIRRLIQNNEKKSSIRIIIRKRYKLSPKTSAWYIREYERHEKAKGNKNPFLEATDEEIIQHYRKSSGAGATARALMVTKYRVETLIDREISSGDATLQKKRNRDNKSTIKPSEARSVARKFLSNHKGKTMTRNQLLDLVCKHEACNRFSIQEIKQLAKDSGIRIIE